MDGDKIKDFLLFNFEKMIVVVVIGLAGFLVYSGMNREDVTEKIKPDQMLKQANAVKLEIEQEDHSEEVIKERVEEVNSFDIKTKLAENRASVPDDIWDLEKFYGPKGPASSERRSDPAIAKPEAVRAIGVLASIAVRTSKEDYPLTMLEPADPLEVEEVKPKREPRRRGRRGGGGDEMMDMEMMDMEMMGMDSDMEMGMDEMSMGAGGVRRLAADADRGHRPTPEQRLVGTATDNPRPALGWFIAGTAVIPHKQIAGSFKAALLAADGYDARRDQPNYVDFQVERADVTTTPIDQLKEDDWVLRSTKKQAMYDAATWWCGTAPEIVPEDYRVNGVTMWIPPVLLDDYKDFSTHPLIPMKSKRALNIITQQTDLEQNGPEALPDLDEIEASTAAKGAGGMNAAYGGGGGEFDMMSGMDEMDDGAYGGYGGGGGFGSTMMIEKDPVDHKLLRFYDFAGAYMPRLKATQWKDEHAPKRGRKYVYRIRFAIDDPNFPQSPELTPEFRTLAPDVYTRVSALRAKAVQENEREFRRWSDWSEPSEPAMLPSDSRFFLGDVEPVKVRRSKVGNRTIEVISDGPKAEVVVEQFSMELGTFIPMRLEVAEGTVLSDSAETADVVDPVSLEVKKLENAKVTSAATVIDIDGGLPLEIAEEDDDLTEPAVFLMMDGQGNLVVKDAIEEREMYRIKSFAKERGK